MNLIENRILSSFKKGFINESYEVDEQVRTRFLTNDIKNNITVLETLKNELTSCKSFVFSVAFITESGLNELKSLFVDLKDKGIKGRLITSHYLYFNSPKIFEELLKIECLEVRVTDSVGYHPKGYLFEHNNYKTLIMGSSNLTSYALKINHEWNLKISSLLEGEVVNSVLDTIDKTWLYAKPLSMEWINLYSLNYREPEVRQIDKITKDELGLFKEIVPNKMQEQALAGISAIREDNKNRGLVVSATGTGKTYLAAFDVKSYKPKKMLFIAHREQILNQAISDFKDVLGNDFSDYGKYSGRHKDKNKRFVFATIQTISRDKHLNLFDEEEFDYILIDEVHKAGADSYLKVIDYFKPKFLMGMTATPERTDDVNIFKIFDYNIAYEIRLQEAIEEEILCDFHYFGVVDYESDGQIIDETSNLSKLISKERINHLLDKINYYGFNGEQVQGLIFTSRVEEAKELSESLNKLNFNTTWLSGEHSITQREEAIERLENNELDYIVTVDIFNEGIDIPSINQVIMMRETQSSIIFTQQLGRGLRKHRDKDFVTIIDFIGNYKKNYLIPVALSGDSSLNKDEIRRKVQNVNYIAGVSSINFEKIAKERIYNSIRDTKIDSVYNLKKEYFKLKNRLGRIPFLYDFYSAQSVDPTVIAESKDSYYNFLLAYDEELKETYPLIENPEHIKLLRLLNKEFVNAKRSHEVILLEYLIKNNSITFEQLKRLYIDNGMFYTDKTISSVISMLDLSFYNEGTKKTYQDFPVIKVEDNLITLSEGMIKALKEELVLKLTMDIIKTVKHKNDDKYDKSNRFKQLEIYTKKDTSRLLEWPKNRSATLFGYAIQDNHCPIYVTYNKHDVESSVDYKDSFINTNTFRWYTRSNRTLESKNVIRIINAKNNGLTLHLFVKKDDATYTSNFYYLGEMTPIENQYKEEVMENGKPVVRIDMKMHNSISEGFYNYLEDRF